MNAAPVLRIGGSISPADIPELCRQVGGLLEGSEGPIVCDVGALVDPDAAAIDALARLQLAAKRRGRRIELYRAHRDLRGLLDLMGLSDVVPVCALSSVESRGQLEQRKQSRGVEKESDSGDPTV